MNARIHIAFRYSALGDVILCTAFLKQLKKLYPHDPIYFVTQESFKGLVAEAFPSSVLGLYIESQKKSLREIFRLGTVFLKNILQERASEELEICFYDLHCNGKSFAFFAGLSLRALFQENIRIQKHSTPKQGLLRLLSVLFRKDLLDPRHVFREHQKILSVAPGSMEYPELRVADVEDSLATKGPYLLFAPESQHWKKCWPEEHWLTLAHTLLEKSPRSHILWVGTHPFQREESFENLLQKYPDRCFSKIGSNTLQELPQLAKNALLCVCSNSAWLHISEAVGTPVITLAGPIVEGFGFSPWQKQSKELSVNLNCRPCTRHGGGSCTGAPEFHACMNWIRPEQVLRELLPWI